MGASNSNINLDVGKIYFRYLAEKLSREDRVNELYRKVTPERPFDVPEVLDVQVVPLSVEFRMVQLECI